MVYILGLFLWICVTFIEFLLKWQDFNWVLFVALRWLDFVPNSLEWFGTKLFPFFVNILFGVQGSSSTARVLLWLSSWFSQIYLFNLIWCGCLSNNVLRSFVDKITCLLTPLWCLCSQRNLPYMHYYNLGWEFLCRSFKRL